MKGAEFTVYKMQGGQWVTYTKATWNDQYKEYMALNLKETDTENRSFKVVETKKYLQDIPELGNMSLQQKKKVLLL